MPFGVRFDDVTSCEVDVIVNSLGTKGSVYGRLCENIINTANDPSLKAYIDKQVNPVGTILVTGAGELKCNNIIHVVTPFKHQDDENNSLLVEAYSKCLSEAIKRKCKSIALPFIGTGANGYSEKDAYNAIMEASSKVLIEEDLKNKEIIDINVIGYLKKKNPIKERKENINRRTNIYEEECSFGYPYDLFALKNEVKKSKKQKDYALDIYDFAQTMSEMNPDELMPMEKIKSAYSKPYSFINYYLIEHGMDELMFTKKPFCMDKRRRSQIKQEKSFKKIDVYRFAFMCRMNKTETLQFMNYLGISFTPFNKLDVFYRDFINGKFKNKNIETFLDLEMVALDYDYDIGSPFQFPVYMKKDK